MVQAVIKYTVAVSYWIFIIHPLRHGLMNGLLAD